MPAAALRETGGGILYEAGAGVARVGPGGAVVAFFFNDTATTEIYTLSLHDALPIFGAGPVLLQLDRALLAGVGVGANDHVALADRHRVVGPGGHSDRVLRVGVVHAGKRGVEVRGVEIGRASCRERV